MLYWPLIQKFNAQHPALQVQFVALDEASQSNNSADSSYLRTVVSAADTAISFVQPTDITNHYVLDLAPYINADAAFERSDYYPAALASNNGDGPIYTLSQTIYAQAFAYNKTRWRAAGLPEPGINLSWEELLAAAQQLKAYGHDATPTYGLMDDGEARLVLMHELEKAQANLFALPAEQVRFDQPNVRAALQQARALVSNGTVYTYAAQAQPITSFEDIARLIRAERLLIWPTDVLPPAALATQLGFDIGYIPIPKLAQPVTLPGQMGYLISAGTQHPTEAWQWLSFLSKQPVGTMQFPYVPARKSLAEATGVLQRLPPELAAVLTATLQGQSNAATDVDEHTWLALTNKPLQFVAGTITIDTALRDAQAELAQRLIRPPSQADTRPVMVATPEVVPDTVTRLEFTTQFGDPKLLQQLAEQFARDNPTIRIRVHFAGSSNSSDSLPEIAQASDCFLWNAPPQHQELHAIADIAPLIAADKHFDIHDYPPTILAPFQQQSGIYGLPLTLQLRALAYNQSIFEQKQLPLPTSDWTLDTLLSTAEQLTKHSSISPTYGYNVATVTPDDIPFFLSRFDAFITQPNHTASVPDLNNPNVVQALKYYTALLQFSATPRQLRGYKAGMLVWNDHISTGQTAMWLTFDSDTSQKPFMHIVAPPGLAHAQNDDINTTAMYISDQTSHPNECWQWLSFLSSSPLQITPHAFPARRSMVETEAFVQQTSPEAIALYTAYRPYLDRESGIAEPDPFHDPMFEPFWFYQAIDQALQGAPIEEALMQAQSTTSDYLACIQQKSTRRACATQADNEYQGLAPYP